MRVVPAVARAIRIIELVVTELDGLSVAEAARRLRLPRNSTYEIVSTLTQSKLVILDLGGMLRPGPTLLHWGASYLRSLDLVKEAQGVARRIAHENDATVHLARLEGREVVYLVKEEGSQQVRMGSAVGHRVLAHATAVGKALIANLCDEEFEQYLASGPWPALTANTITDPTDLREQRLETLRSGVALDDQESSPEVCCVASVVRGAAGDVVAAMSISTLHSRFVDAFKDELSRTVLRGATELSERLGWRQVT